MERMAEYAARAARTKALQADLATAREQLQQAQAREARLRGALKECLLILQDGDYGEDRPR